MSPASGLSGEKGPPSLLAVIQAPAPQEQLGSRGHISVYSGTVWPQMLRSSCPTTVQHTGTAVNLAVVYYTNMASGAHVPKEGDANHHVET